jgi:hypothetical protein
MGSRRKGGGAEGKREKRVMVRDLGGGTIGTFPLRGFGMGCVCSWRDRREEKKGRKGKKKYEGREVDNSGI